MEFQDLMAGPPPTHLPEDPAAAELESAPAREVVRSLVHRLRQPLEELGDWDEVQELSENALARGNSAAQFRRENLERNRRTRRV